MHKKGFYEKYLKRSMDFIIALFALILLSPVLLMITLLVRIKLGSPILFKQKRPGLNEKIFTLYKFRTMTNQEDKNGELLSEAARLTKFGKLLRSTSLDELPSLINIIIGDLSIVGPRPLLVEYLPLYNNVQKKRHDVRPGLTGLAQVNGRNALSWEEKFKLDITYISKITFIKDMKIMIKTGIKVFKREGITTKSEEIPERFKGNDYDNSSRTK